MSRPRGRPRRVDNVALDGIPGTAPGTGLVVRKKTRLMGVMGLGNGLPRPVEDVVVQKTLVEVPDVCGQCGSAAITFMRSTETSGPARRVSCFMCGWDAYLVTPSAAPVLGAIEVERRGVVVANDAPRVRSARPRRIDRRKHPSSVPEPPPKYAYKAERSTNFRKNNGVEITL
jgi:hypothetical protein